MQYALSPGLRSIGVDRGEIGPLEIGKVAEDFILCHAGCEHIQNLPDCHSQAADTGLSRALTWDYGDSGKIGLISTSHVGIIAYLLNASLKQRHPGVLQFGPCVFRIASGRMRLCELQVFRSPRFCSRA